VDCHGRHDNGAVHRPLPETAGCINQDVLAKMFAEEYARDPQRGYGGAAHGILRAIAEGMSWKAVARRAFGGQGSCGNGGAMRAAPIGAYFADDCERVVYEARLSAEVTHAHPDGQTGAAARHWRRLGWSTTAAQRKSRACADRVRARTDSADGDLAPVETGLETPAGAVSPDGRVGAGQRDSSHRLGIPSRSASGAPRNMRGITPAPCGRL